MTRPWTDEEVAILRERYPTGGSVAVMSLLPGRNRDAIHAKVKRLGIGVDGHTWRRQGTSQWIDAAIKRAYEKGGVDVKALAKSIDRTHGWTKWRALEMGLSQPASADSYRFWTPEEDALLERCLERGRSVTTIARKFRAAGLPRTAAAIRNRMNNRDLQWQRDFWTASDVAKALGVDMHRVTQWIGRGQLKAKHARGPSYDDHPAEGVRLLWQIRPAELRRFMIAHPHEWDHRKMHKEVLLDLLLGGDYGMNAGGLSVAEAGRLAG